MAEKILTQGEFRLDNWQRRVLETEGNITIRAGRQVGKSTVIAIKAADFAIQKPGTVTLVIAASQRQSSLLFEKIRGEIDHADEEGRCEYAEEPTLTRIILKNGSKIYSLPAGRTGYFIRGFTLDLLIVDEAAYVPEEVWRAVIPMIAVSKKIRKLGWIILLSTPFGKGGYFFDTFHDSDFRQFHINSEDCPRIPKDFLLKEKKRMTKQEYAQEYMGEFIDDWAQFFPSSLIKRCATFISWKKSEEYNPKNDYYLGVDIARYGQDENAFIIAEIDRSRNVKVVKAMTTMKMSLTDTVGRIKKLDDEFDFNRIFIDDAGVGGGVMDMLLEDQQTKRKSVGLNNARRNIEGGRQKTLLKEDMYSNALMLMEAGKLEMISDLDLIRSLKGMIFEYTSEKNVKIHGQKSHLAEAFVRACWGIKERGLRVFIA